VGTLSNVWSHTNLWGVGEAARKEENKILPLSLSLISELLRAVPPHIRTETHTRICSFYKVNSALRQNKNTHRIYSAIWEIFALASSADNIFAILRWEPTAGRLSGSGIFLIFNQSWPLAASSRSAERHLLLSLCECVCEREREKGWKRKLSARTRIPKNENLDSLCIVSPHGRHCYPSLSLPVGCWERDVAPGGRKIGMIKFAFSLFVLSGALSMRAAESFHYPHAVRNLHKFTNVCCCWIFAYSL